MFIKFVNHIVLTCNRLFEMYYKEKTMIMATNMNSQQVGGEQIEVQRH